MRNRLLLVCFTVLCCFSWGLVGYAQECDEKHLKSLADNVEVSVEFDYDAVQDGRYSGNNITILGITDEIYMEADNSSLLFDISDSVDGIISRYVVDTSADKLLIYSTKCPNLLLRTIDIELKSYNFLSDYPECDGLKDKVEMCGEFYDGILDYDRLKNQVKAYKSKSPVEKVADESNQLLNFIVKYGLYVVIALLLIVGIGVGLYRFRKNKLD